mmetsp:Transcript_118764/g.343480  ORF Transcript_118764/g.343480 Transcript_118764/m.343480 type:complete len:99 (+) Transcript_118764:62-358(+)
MRKGASVRRNCKMNFASSIIGLDETSLLHEFLDPEMKRRQVKFHGFELVVGQSLFCWKAPAEDSQAISERTTVLELASNKHEGMSTCSQDSAPDAASD